MIRLFLLHYSERVQLVAVAAKLPGAPRAPLGAAIEEGDPPARKMPDQPATKRPSTSYLSRAKEKARGSSKKATTKVSPKADTKDRTPEEWAAERAKVENQAASQIQTQYVANKKEKKRNLVRRKTAVAATTVKDKALHAAHDISHKIDEATHHATFGHVQQFISSSLRQQCADDPWLMKGAQDAVLETVDMIIAEVKRRTLNELEETSGKASIRLKKQLAALVMPETWPLPPSRLNVLAWLRARFLYGLFPADKNATYRKSIEPWMSMLDLLFYMPYGIGTSTWLLYISIVLFTVDDLYQLFMCICSFRCFAFIFWGCIPILTDWFQMYIAFSGGDTLTHVLQEDHGVASNLRPNSLLVEGGPSTGVIDQFQDRVFILNWVLCWAVFAKYKWRRSQYLSLAAEPPVYTGDRDRGDKEPTALMAYDVLVTCAIALLSSLDLTYRILRLSGAQAYFVTLFNSIMMRPQEGTHLPLAVDIYFAALTTFMGLSAGPFLAMLAPSLGELIHQMRATGFDAAGDPQLQMTLPQMKRKQQKLAARGMLNKIESETLASGHDDESTTATLLNSARSKAGSARSKVRRPSYGKKVNASPGPASTPDIAT